MILKPKIISFLCLANWLICPIVFAEEESPGNFKNPQVVQEVLEGKRKIANAAWWGFDKDDSTVALQNAINSGASKVIIPYMGSDWIVRPIKLAGNQEIYFEPGVVVVAKKGEFKGRSNCLFSAVGKKNIILRGYGATLKMQKTDYTNTNLYEKSEWRMGIALHGCSNIQLYGLTIKDTGGDGIYVGGHGIISCKDIQIKDCICDNNHRQGISIISAENLLIDNCVLKNTNGTEPSAGIDLEPNNNQSKLSNIVIQNCISNDNAGAGFIVSVKYLDVNSEDISILFYNCYIEGCKWGIVVSSEDKDSPKGLVEFRNCFIENSTSPGIWISIDKRGFSTVFDNCTLQNCAKDYTFDKRRNSPVRVRGGRSITNKSFGSIIFKDLYIYDNPDRPKLFFYFWPNVPDGKSENVSGNIFYNSKQREKTLDSNISIDLKTKSMGDN